MSDITALRAVPSTAASSPSTALAWWLSLAIAITAVRAVAQAYPVRQADADCLSAGLDSYYPPLNSPPLAQVTRAKDDSAPPDGAACFDKTDSAATWITVASTTRTGDSQSTLIRRFGAISELLNVQYWSTTDHKWRPLVSSASAVDGTKLTEPRANYSPAELATGDDRYYRITDTRSGRATTYRLRLTQARQGRFVVETSNRGAIREWGLTLYPANGLDTFYFLDERSPGVWAYYSITRILLVNVLAEGHEKSYINRAIALYRHYMNLPTDAEPPAAP